jgi:hypothetical protein
MDEDAYIKFVEMNYDDLVDEFVMQSSAAFDKFCLRSFQNEQADVGDALYDAERETDVPD